MRKFITPFLLTSLVILLFTSSAFGLAQAVDSSVQKSDYFKTRLYYESILKNSGDKNSEQNNQINRWMWENRFKEIPGSIRTNTNRELYSSSVKKSKGAITLSQKGWAPLGPINIPPAYDSRSCYCLGRISCVAFHPTNKDIFWIAASTFSFGYVALHPMMLTEAITAKIKKQ